MITLYTGTPGSGKSLHIAQDILRWCKKKKDCLVVCNFPVFLNKLKHPSRFVFLENPDLSPPSIVSLCRDFFDSRGLPTEEGRVLLVIDEAQLIFNSRDWREDGRRDWLSFFSQHRKFGVDVILACQYDQMIDKQIRTLVEYEVVHRKVTNNGSLGLILRLFAFGDLFVAVEKWYSLQVRTSTSYFRFSKKYYGLYDTFRLFETKSIVQST